MFTLPRAVRSALLPLLTLLLAGFVSVGTASSGSAASGAADVYRYWGYYTVTDGAFVAPETGPAGARCPVRRGFGEVQRSPDAAVGRPGPADAEVVVRPAALRHQRLPGHRL